MHRRISLALSSVLSLVALLLVPVVALAEPVPSGASQLIRKVNAGVEVDPISLTPFISSARNLAGLSMAKLEFEFKLTADVGSGWPIAEVLIGQHGVLQTPQTKFHSHSQN